MLQSSTPWIGRVVEGRYRITNLLGEGAMGAVFVAEHLTLQKHVALKVVHPDRAGEADIAARFAREAMAASRLDHPNVISVLDYGRLGDGGAYLAMQLVDGPSLAQVFGEGRPLHWARMADIGAQIADALVAAQQHDIVHRDLKPENILLQPIEDGPDLVKVLDFGVAKFGRDSSAPAPVKPLQAMTTTGYVMGTPGYMAPEQALGEPADLRADLYALGVILWEGVVGHRLWPGDTLQEVVRWQLSGPAPGAASSDGNPDVPGQMERLITELLASQPEHRPDNPVEVRDQLRAMAREIPREEWKTMEADHGSARPFRRTPRISGTVPVLPASSRSRQAPSEDLYSDPVSVPSIPPPSIVPASLGLILVLLLMAVGAMAAGVADTAAIGRVLGTAEHENGVPPELELTLWRLVHTDRRSVGVASAQLLRAHVHPEEIAPYVLGIAQVRLAKTCRAKRVHVLSLEQVGDPRALPFLRRLSERPRRGCGAGKRQDCLACLRAPLANAIATLEGP